MAQDAMNAEQVDDFEDLLKQECTVYFAYDGRLRTATLTVPTTAQVEKVRRKYVEWLQKYDGQNDSEVRSGNSKLAKSFDFVSELETHACEWLRLTFPNAKGKTDTEIKAFLNRLDGGVNSKLVITARNLCGLSMAGGAVAETPF